MSEIKKTIIGLGLGGYAVGANTCEVHVKDGKIVRTVPFHVDKSYPAESLRPWEMNIRGHQLKASLKTEIAPFVFAYKKRLYSENRILYPMKRVDWDPNGNRNTQNRGESKFERISWDEATDIIASEINRVIDTYGKYSILLQGDGHGEAKCVNAAHACHMKMLELLGGYTYQARNSDSWEGWTWGAAHVWGCAPVGQAYQGNCLLDVAENAEMLLFWGCDMETNTWGWTGQLASRYCNFLTEIGVKQVYVCPDVNYGNAAHADKWIPVLPNTDAALQLAIAYVWITEGLYDAEYLKTHSVGFEWEEYYILGHEDGIPKTPEWASPICGVPVRQIKALARQWHKLRTSIAHCNGGSYIRSIYSHEPGRMEAVLMAMQAIGTPGRNIMKFIEWGIQGLTDEQNAAPMNEHYAYGCGAAFRAFSPRKASYDLRQSFIPKCLVQTALLGDYTAEHPLTWRGVGLAGWPVESQFPEYRYPVEGAEPIHMIWTDNPCWSACWNGGNEFVRALRQEQIEFVLAQHPWMEDDCLFADILLPINTKFEENDISFDPENGEYSLLYLEPQVVESRGESMSDYEAVCEIAKKLGVYEAYTEGKSIDDWIKVGFDSSGADKYISWEEFQEKGYVAFPYKENWEERARGFELFAKDPDNNPMTTPTGKFEIYSTRLATYFPDDLERGPYAKWVESGVTHPSERLGTPRAEKYPFLLVSNHPHWRVHAQLDDITWFREIQTCKVKGPDGYLYEPLWIHPSDAEKLGIEHGDIVKIFNERGWVLGGAYVTERIIPGSVLQDHGAREDPIEAGVSDRAGSNNLIAPSGNASKNVVAEVTSGFLVGVEKVDVFELAKQYPEAFSRKFDESGICLENWFVE